MIALIQRHNRLNGILFSIAEFAVISLFIGAYAIYYLTHGRATFGLITLGIAMNGLPVVAIGVSSLMNRTAKDRVASIWNRKARHQHLRNNPHMLRDTLMLSTATLLPFVALILLLFDLAKKTQA